MTTSTMSSEKFTPFSQLLATIRQKYPSLSKRLKEAEAVSRWDGVVGQMISKHARALRVEKGVLYVEVDHPIWRSELHHRKRQILDALNSKGIEGSTPLVDLMLVDPSPAGGARERR